MNIVLSARETRLESEKLMVNTQGHLSFFLTTNKLQNVALLGGWVKD